MIELAVDSRNPGEVLAACGLFNLAVRHGRAMGQFTEDGQFRLDTSATLEELLAPLNRKTVIVAEDHSRVLLDGIALNWWKRKVLDFKPWAGQVNPDNLCLDLLTGLSLKLADKLECGDFVTRSGDNHSIGFASFYRG
jgi:hypothetical protein